MNIADELTNLLQNAASYTYNTLRKLLKSYVEDANTILLVDNRLLCLAARDSLPETSIPIEYIVHSDYIVAYLANTIGGFQERLEPLLELSLLEYPHYAYVVKDLHDSLGIPYGDKEKELLEPITLENYKSVLQQLVESNRRIVEKYMLFVQDRYKARAQRLVAHILESGKTHVVYLGSYGELVRDVFEAEEGIALDIIDFGEDTRLFQMLFMDTKEGPEIFFDTENRPIHAVSDARHYQSADLLDVPYVNYITGLGLGIYPLKTDIQDSAELYRRLLPYYEHTDYNFLSSATKNLLFDTKNLAEEGAEAGEYADTIPDSTLADSMLLPEDVIASYVPKLEQKIHKDNVIVGISTYGVSEQDLLEKISFLQAEPAVTDIIIAGEPMVDNASKVNYVPLGKNFPATLNNIARKAVEIGGFLHYLDGSDPVPRNFYKDVSLELARDRDVDIWTLRTFCIKDLHLMHPPVIACEQLASLLEANIYLSASALVVSTGVLQYVLFDEELEFNSQYEFLFRAVLHGANVEPTVNITVWHEYEFGKGKHLRDKTNYTRYIDAVKVKHADAWKAFEATKKMMTYTRENDEGKDAAEVNIEVV